MMPVAALRKKLASPSKKVRLKALKLLITHPEASPLDIVQGLCSDDNRDFEFLEVFELNRAMRSAWPRIKGINDAEVYDYLATLYTSDPLRHGRHVVFILELICTRRALSFLNAISASAPAELAWSITQAETIITRNLG